MAMNSELPFPHHNFQDDPSSKNFELIGSDRAAANEDPQANDVLEVSGLLRQAKVVEIVLVHGTFAGNDILGIMREVARFSPWLADSMRSFGKELFDQLAGELGNYTQEFADRCSTLVNPDCPAEHPDSSDPSSIVVTRFNWSGENHHLGRAGGAIALLDYLSTQSYAADERVLIWGHSHGGNLLAMMGHLLAASEEARNAFFSATQTHYRDPILGRLDLPLWEKVRQKMADPHFLEDVPLMDVVTFGTPLRYRWNENVFSNLLHFVQHRQQDDASPARGELPQSIQDVLTAKGGDYVQQLGIGGTDFLHSVIAWRSWNSERRLRAMFEPSVRRRDLAKNLQQGRRVSLDGSTLLVDYPTTEEKWNQKLIGHGVYTRHEWLPFHLQELTSRFYATQEGHGTANVKE